MHKISSKHGQGKSDGSTSAVKPEPKVKDTKMEVTTDSETDSKLSESENETPGKRGRSEKYAKLEGDENQTTDGSDTSKKANSPMDTAKGFKSDKKVSKDTAKVNLDNSVNTTEKPAAKIAKERRKIDAIDYLELEDVLILCDLFYLPYEFGPRAIHLLKRGHWLVDNAVRVRDFDKNKVSISERSAEVREWFEKAVHFHDCFKEAASVVDKLVNIPNRVLLYELYNYISDMRCTLSLVNSYVKWNGEQFNLYPLIVYVK